ncbi:transcription factor [Pestalotiopsis sp. IQ-011]
MALVLNSLPPRPISRSSSFKIRRKSSWAALLQERSIPRANRTDPELPCYDDGVVPISITEPWRNLDTFTRLGLTLDHEDDDHVSRVLDVQIPSIEIDHAKSQQTEPSPDLKPFHRWMKTLQRKSRHKRLQSSSADLEAFPGLVDDSSANSCHRRSSSDSSFGYVAGVRSATISIDGSALTRSRRNTAQSSAYARTDRSARASVSIGRRSEDSVRSERSVADPAVTERLLQRRRILEELIGTEESYIGDVKFLMNVYVTILASLPTQHSGLRSSINRNLTEIVELHEEILEDLYQAVPESEYTPAEQSHVMPKPAAKAARHQRWRSLDSVPEDETGASWLHTTPGMTADPDVAAHVAKIFRARMHRFFVYEEYGAKYEMMIRDVASAPRAMPQWETYQKGLEALAASLGSVNHQLDCSRKSLTIGDLLVKPIQRICKYPLLFAELLKHTPVCDCPSSHSEIESVLARLREATSEINRATDDPYNYAELCTSAGRHVEELKASTWSDQLYTIQACIGLNTIKIEEADNGRVILKNTTTVKETPNPTADVPNINRSQSLLTTTTRIPILAPPRGDRARIEAQLSDVWSRKILPFPGITPRSRSEHLVRASASTMMRKLSVASITNSFAKRSGSSASMSTMKASEESAHHANESTESMAKRSCDSSSITLGADQDHVDVQRLPVIRDATERASGCSARNSFDDGLVMSGMTRRHCSEKSQTSESEGSEDVIETAPSRDALALVSPTDSVSRPPAQHALQAVKYEARPAPMKKKENVSKANLAKRPVQETTSPVKPSKRSRATGSERSSVAGAIRSFFR